MLEGIKEKEKKERKKRAHHGLDKTGKDTSFSRPIIVLFSSADALRRVRQRATMLPF